MVSNSVENDCQKSNSITKLSKTFTKSRRENLTSNSKLVTETGGMVSIKQSFSSKGISERAINLISSTRRTGSQSNYALVLKGGLAGVIQSKLIPLVTI